MHVTKHVLTHYALSNAADLLITGDEEKIIKALLDHSLGTHIANIGNVVAVRLKLHELATLVNVSEEDILIVQLNRNLGKLDGKTKVQASKAAKASEQRMGASLENR